MLRRDMLDPLAWVLSRRELHGLLHFSDPRQIVEAARRYRGRGHYSRLRPVQKAWEITRLVERVAAQQPRAVLELGTAKGGTLWMWCRATTALRFVSVDLPGGLYGGGYHCRRQKLYREFIADRPHAEMTLIRADSHAEATLEAVTTALGGTPLDFLFIDGDHRYEGVRRDFELYQRLVTAGGIIAFHDILPRIAFPDYGVHRFWAEVKPGYRHEELIEDPNQGMMGIGLLIKD